MMENGFGQKALRLFLLSLLIFLFGIPRSYAQIGELGIYGSPTVIFRASVRYVRLEHYPECECGFFYTLPLNGHKNFNFYYNPDGPGSFLPGGGYKVTYLGADQTTAYGYDIVSYSPNSGHTNGVAVGAFIDPPSSPLGIHGTVYGYNSAHAVIPLNNLNVSARLGSEVAYAKTNGNGFFSAYYTYGNTATFLPTGDHWAVHISGFIDGCGYDHLDNSSVIWQPLTDPTEYGYYVNGAEMNLDQFIPILECMPPPGN